MGRLVGGEGIYANFLINLDMSLKLFSELEFISLKKKREREKAWPDM